MKQTNIIQNDRNKILNANTPFSVIEAYKLIRTNIMFSLPKTEGGKIIAVTSSSPSEGKTTTTVNLAITFAQLGAKVVIIDCDLRKARVHKYLSLHRGTGVSNILCGFSNVEKSLMRNVRENLDVLTAGEIPPNPAELLASESFDALLDELIQKYDYVFIDTPPVAVVADGILIARRASGTAVVVRGNVTTYDLLDNTITTLKKNGINILGTIMLDGEASSGSYKYSYSKKHGYNYKYGDDPETKSL